jgi:hypothetical protein
MVQNAGKFAPKQTIIHVHSHTLQENHLKIYYTLVIWVTFPESCWQNKGMSLIHVLQFPHAYILNMANPLDPSGQNIKQNMKFQTNLMVCYGFRIVLKQKIMNGYIFLSSRVKPLNAHNRAKIILQASRLKANC